MAVAEFNKNGDGSETPKLDPDYKRILVLGEPKCGKTSFIRTFARDNLEGFTYPDTGAIVYKYTYYHMGELRKYAFIEIPGVLVDQLDTAVFNHLDSKGCIFVFAIDDPSSYQQLREKWIPRMNVYMNFMRCPAIAVGFKADLRENPQVIQRLALANLFPVTTEEGQSLVELPHIERYFECSRNDLPRVNDAWTFILPKAYAVE